MNYPLAKALFDRNLFTNDMEITATYIVSTLGKVKDIPTTGNFFIQTANTGPNDIQFLALSTRDGSKILLNAEDVTAIDGMSPERFAEVYDIKADGSSKPPAKRRGRKPKNRNVVV